MCGWHSDSHPQLGRNPPVASVSLGAVRVFELRKKKVKICRLLRMVSDPDPYWIRI
jgi:alkylated DNA repair dioxygenase AlkB